MAPPNICCVVDRRPTFLGHKHLLSTTGCANGRPCLDPDYPYCCPDGTCTDNGDLCGKGWRGHSSVLLVDSEVVTDDNELVQTPAIVRNIFPWRLPDFASVKYMVQCWTDVVNMCGFVADLSSSRTFSAVVACPHTYPMVQPSNSGNCDFEIDRSWSSALQNQNQTLHQGHVAISPLRLRKL